VTADTAVARKALAAVCDDVRPAGPGLSVSPGSAEEAAAVIRVAAELGLTMRPRGGGSRLWWGTPADCDLVIDTGRMSGVVEHAAGDLVARVRAGTRMGDVAAELAKAGQEIALDVPPDATVGGVLASGLAGPRRLRYGTPRDLLIGITIVRADGTVAKSGGKVVKNVAGYDLGKLFAGSAGTLGLITEATFRLHPLPAARAFVTAEYTAAAAACDAVAAAANSPLTASAVELSRAQPGGLIRVGVLLEGSADGVAARAARMSGLLGSPPATATVAAPATSVAASVAATSVAASVAAGRPAWWPAPLAAGPDQTLVRVSLWVSALGRVLDAVEAAARQAGVRPAVDGSAGAGLLYLRLAEDGPAAQAAFIARLREAVAGQRGAVTVLTAPHPVRAELAGRGGMSGPVPGLALMRSVKDRFDPRHLLAPGQFPDVA